LSRTNPPEYSVAKRHVEEFLSKLPDLSNESKSEIIEPWTNEISADLIGLQLMLSQTPDPPYYNWENHKQWLCGGVEISHLMNLMLSEYYDRLNHGKQIRLVSSHPHDYLRWKAVSISEAKTSFADHLNLGKTFSRFTLDVLASCFKKTKSGLYKPMP
jgi:hypothetical protein